MFLVLCDLYFVIVFVEGNGAEETHHGMYCGAGARCFASASQEDLKSKVVMWALFGRSSPSPSSVGTCLTVSNCCVYEMLTPHFDALYSRCLKLFEWRK